MRIYLAGNGHLPFLKDDFTDFYRLESFHYIAKRELPFINRYKSFLLDSGAFTFMNKSNDNVNWNAYIEEYAAFINEHNVELFFELDIDPIVGIDKVEELRHKLENLTGKQCIPVWHKSRGKDYWLRMIQEYGYVAIGGIVTREIKPAEYPYFTWFLNEAAKNNCKVHGLGFTNLREIERYRFYSVDSTSWISGNRFGGVYTFNGRSMDKHNKQPGQRVKTHETARNNFYEWVRFQKYADINL